MKIIYKLLATIIANQCKIDNPDIITNDIRKLIEKSALDILKNYKISDV